MMQKYVHSGTNLIDWSGVESNAMLKKLFVACTSVSLISLCDLYVMFFGRVHNLFIVTFPSIQSGAVILQGLRKGQYNFFSIIWLEFLCLCKDRSIFKTWADDQHDAATLSVRPFFLCSVVILPALVVFRVVSGWVLGRPLLMSLY